MAGPRPPAQRSCWPMTPFWLTKQAKPLAMPSPPNLGRSPQVQTADDVGIVLHRAVCGMLAATAGTLAPASRIIVLGPGSLEMRLIAAKLAAREGFVTSLVAAQGAGLAWRRFLYGAPYAAAGCAPTRYQRHAM